MGGLDSRVVVITGGSLGIGREVARKCVSEGATVVIGARGEEALAKTLKELYAIKEKPHRSYTIDVGKTEEVKGFARFCAERFPEIHGLVNCAGVYGPIGKTTEVDMEEFAAAIRINFLGTVLMCHAFAPLLKGSTDYADYAEKKCLTQRRKGAKNLRESADYADYAEEKAREPGGRKKIVNYSGGGAAGPFPRFSAYATSKTAIVRFTENLALELADESFDVNCIAPGFVITRLHQDTLKAGPQLATESFYENTKKQMESGGVPPEKAADLTAFLLSDASDGITGKFLSAPWDPWQEKAFQERLRKDKDFATLRRIDDKTFFKNREA